MSAAASIVNFGDWDVESIRLSIFHPQVEVPSGLWEQLMGVAPENMETRPREGIRQEQGAVDDNRLLLVVQNGRLDWNFLPSPSPDRGVIRGALPTLVAAEQTMPMLIRALNLSLRPVGQVYRLALGATLVQQASDLSEGLKQLSKYLPRLDLENHGGSDFSYQINKPRRSPSAPHVQINRLSRWLLEEIQGGAFTIGPSQQPSFQASERTFVSKLILDINTAFGNNAIAIDRMPRIFEDLVHFSCEIAVEGDIP